MSLHSNFDFEPPQKPFYLDVMKTIIQQDDFRGIGMHDWEDHGPHGLHRQTSIGLGNDMTVNFRELSPPPFELDHFDRYEPPELPRMYEPPPMPVFEPPVMTSYSPPPAYDPGPCLMNEAQQAFYNPAPLMNEAQQAFYNPPPMNLNY